MAARVCHRNFFSETRAFGTRHRIFITKSCSYFNQVRPSIRIFGHCGLTKIMCKFCGQLKFYSMRDIIVGFALGRSTVDSAYIWGVVERPFLYIFNGPSFRRSTSPNFHKIQNKDTLFIIDLKHNNLQSGTGHLGEKRPHSIILLTCAER